MHLYSGSTIDFIGDSARNTIASKLERAFFHHFRYEAPKSEARAWQSVRPLTNRGLKPGAVSRPPLP
jgi:hypothetical protein